MGLRPIHSQEMRIASKKISLLEDRQVEMKPGVVVMVVEGVPGR